MVRLKGDKEIGDKINKIIGRLAEASELPEAGYSAREIAAIKAEVGHYENVRREVKLASGDYIDLKVYEPAMRHLIDAYIRAEDSQKISTFDDITLIQLLVERGTGALAALPAGLAADPGAMAETIENNLRRLIIDEHPINPKYYEKMSDLLDGLINERRAQASDYAAYLARIIDLARQVQNPNATTYPTSLDTRAKRALYDNLGGDEQLALAVHNAIEHIRKDGWRGNTIKEREVRYAIRRHVQDEARIADIFELVKSQSEY